MDYVQKKQTFIRQPLLHPFQPFLAIFQIRLMNRFNPWCQDWKSSESDDSEDFIADQARVGGTRENTNDDLGIFLNEQ